MQEEFEFSRQEINMNHETYSGIFKHGVNFQLGLPPFYS